MSNNTPNSEKPVYRAKTQDDKPSTNKNVSNSVPHEKNNQSRQYHASTSARSSRKKKQKKFSFGSYLFNNKKQSIIAICVFGGILILVIIAILIALFSSKSSAAPLSESLSIESGALVTDSNYNPNAFALPTDQTGNTILGQTERADDEYLENTLFLGDSNTARMLFYRDSTCTTLQNNIGVVGMGVQSVPTLDCASFKGINGMVTMPEAVKLLQPERIVITFGTNNAGAMKVDTFIKKYTEALDAIHEAYPYSDIIIGAVPPIAKQHTNESLTMTSIDQYNLALVELAKKEGYKFLNWTDALKDSSTGYAKAGYMLGDGIHLTRNGMEAMFEYIRTHAYITDDDRPKPLKTIPERTGTLPSIISTDATTNTSNSKTTTSTSANSTRAIATVAFSASAGGSLQINRNTTSGTTVQVPIGDTCPTVTAIANEGYRFSYWTCSVGSLDAGNSTLSGFKVPTNVNNGDTITITAVFERTEDTSSSDVQSTESAPPPSSSLINSTPAASSDQPTPSAPPPSSSDNGTASVATPPTVSEPAPTAPSTPIAGDVNTPTEKPIVEPS